MIFIEISHMIIKVLSQTLKNPKILEILLFIKRANLLWLMYRIFYHNKKF